MNNETIKQIHAVGDYLNEIFLERADVIGAVKIALLTGYPLTLISKPGTAKTAMVSALYSLIDGRSFDFLMTRYTTPDELAGPLSLTELAKGNMARVTTNTVVGADAVFLDECFKANSATLNAQLSMLNEREFEGHDCPWVAWVGASNEYPDGIDGQAEFAGDSLEALWDRYVLRCELDYMRDPSNIKSVCFGANQPSTTPEKLNVDDLRAAQREVNDIEVPDEIQEQYIKFLMQCRSGKLPVMISDRKAVKGVLVLKAAAALAGRTKVTLHDFHWLTLCMWSSPRERGVLNDIVLDYVPQLQRQASEAYGEAKTVYRSVMSGNKLRTGCTTSEMDGAIAKMRAVKGLLEQWAAESQDDTQTADSINEFLADVTKLSKQLIKAISQRITRMEHA